MSDPCKHDTVTRGSIDLSGMEDFGPIWTCTECADQFAPVEVIQRIEAENDRIIDMVTSVFSATLWDFHQRAKESGQEDSIAANTMTGKELAESICEEKGHNRGNDGVCDRCGNSPFLG